jgi:hypothetical protein
MKSIWMSRSNVPQSITWPYNFKKPVTFSGKPLLSRIPDHLFYASRYWNNAAVFSAWPTNTWASKLSIINSYIDQRRSCCHQPTTDCFFTFYGIPGNKKSGHVLWNLWLTDITTIRCGGHTFEDSLHSVTYLTVRWFNNALLTAVLIKVLMCR